MTYLLGGAMPEYPTLAALLRRRHRRRAEAAPSSSSAGRSKSATATSCAPRPSPLERGKIYEGGNLARVRARLGVTGDRILYVGDHIYGDILRSKKESSWRTAMIIQEMEAEVIAHESCATDLGATTSSKRCASKLEDELRYHQARFKELTRQIEAHQPRARTVRHSPTFRQNEREPSEGSSACECCSAKSKKRVFVLVDRIDQALSSLLGIAAQGGQRKVELRRPSRRVRLPLHVARLELPRLLAPAVLPQPQRPDAARALRNPRIGRPQDSSTRARPSPTGPPRTAAPRPRAGHFLWLPNPRRHERRSAAPSRPRAPRALARDAAFPLSHATWSPSRESSASIGSKRARSRFKADGSTAPAFAVSCRSPAFACRAVSKKSVVPAGLHQSKRSRDRLQRSGQASLRATTSGSPRARVRRERRSPTETSASNGYCVDTNRVAPLASSSRVSAALATTHEPMNDPRLNQLPGTLAPTGSFGRCTNSFHVYDMVGNVHEWTADPRHVPRRLLPRHAHQRRRLRLPHGRARRRRTTTTPPASAAAPIRSCRRRLSA